MLKTIVGVPGDHISARDEGIEIDGVMLAGSVPRMRSVTDPRISLPTVRGKFVLPPCEYWVYGGGAHSVDSERSFDSRYFGAVSIAQIRGVVMR